LRQLLADIQPTLHLVLPRRSSMRAAIGAVLTGFGEPRDVAPVGLDAPTPVTVHRSIIRIGHDDFMTDLLEVLRDPLTLSRCLHQNSHAWTAPKDLREPLARRRNPVVDHLPTRRHDPNLTFLLVKVDGTILHGWSPLCALSASSQCGAEATTSRRGPAASSYQS